MTDLTLTPQWEAGIYQLQINDPVLGGPEGISNRQAQQLGNRTEWLKAAIQDGSDALAAHAASRNHPSATTALQGLVSLATAAEGIAGSDATKAMTPAAAKAAIQALAPPASTTAAGLVELATGAEAAAMTDATRAVTPAGLAAIFEAGTWTPTFSASTMGNLVVTYAVRGGEFYRVGRLCHVNAAVEATLSGYTTASGYVYLYGLPFAAMPGRGAFTLTTHAGLTYPSSRTWLTGAVAGGGTGIVLMSHGTAVDTSQIAISAFPPGSSLKLHLVGSYIIA